MNLRRLPAPTSALLVAALTAVSLTACSSGNGERETVVVKSTTFVNPDGSEVDPADFPEWAKEPSSSQQSGEGDWKSEYENVIAHPDEYAFDTDALVEPTGKYSYALIEVTGDGTPELLLKKDSREFAPVLVFHLDEEGKARPSSPVLLDGVRSAGGSRAAVYASASQNGLYQEDHYSTQPDANFQLYSVDGETLTKSGEPEVARLDAIPDKYREVDWTPTTDPSALAQGVPAAAAQAEDAPVEDDGGLTGTVRMITAAELPEIRGQANPNNEDPDSQYFVLWFDSPREISALLAGSGTDTRTVDKYVSLGARESINGHDFERGVEWEAYVGKRVRIDADPSMLSWTTDTSLPGSAWVNDYNDVTEL
ncbi:hypothetical protein CKJ81_02925 [Corynebacterium hadale]|uniref:Lipoprotein n=1 Tax=Corynebacterium hadale TaxID=2026255 RepID=A0ABX4HBS2_9CORY|nr:hypothetical protein [Corynebacterium hadale]PAT06900.1 hypothetical protein CKJ81_02925 [Corynebacterium hadale]